MSDLLNPYGKSLGKLGPTEKSISSPAGTVFIENTSYSGVDIQIYAHVYDPKNASLYRLKALTNEIKLAQTAQDTGKSDLARYRKKLESIHTDTPEEEKILRQIDNQIQKNRAIDNSLDAMSTDLSRTELSLATGAVIPLGTLQTISISTNRDKRDVRALGHVGPKGRTRGPRSYAGTMVFTVFDQHPLTEIMHAHSSEFDGVKFSPALVDQMPPIDLTLVFANEYGHISRMSIYGVDFATDGKVMSIQDIMTEETLSFFAWDYDPMRSVAQRRIDENYHLANDWTGVRASMLIFEEDFQEATSELNPFLRFIRRQDPYV